MTDLEILAKAFCENQTITRELAEKIAAKILAADADIAKAALDWAQSGIMPATPEIENMSPVSLSAKYEPTQVFTILLVLRKDTEHAKGMLRYFEKEQGNRLQ